VDLKYTTAALLLDTTEWGLTVAVQELKQIDIDATTTAPPASHAWYGLLL